MSSFNVDMNNIVAVTHQLLARLNVKANKHTISAILEDQPANTSLLAISECLKIFKVESISRWADKENFTTTGLQVPFIAHFSGCAERFVLVHSSDPNGLKISDERGKNQQLSTTEFLKFWDGIVLIATAGDKSGEEHFYRNRLRYFFRQALLPLLFAATGLLLISKAFSLPILLLSLIKLAGVVVSALLLSYNLNENSTLLKNICGSGGRSGCKNTLSSKGAMLTSWLSWSEVGFYYFTGSFFVTLFLPVLTPVLSWMNIAALPFTVYSISYQYKMRNWCVLCCTVQGLLLFECLLFNQIRGSWNTQLTMNPTLWLLFILCFIFPILAWSLQKPILQSAAQVIPLKQELKKFKSDHDLFIYMLRKQEYHPIADDLMPLVLGNPRAKNIITMLSNPFCGPCAETHRLIDKWLQQTDDLQVKLLFYIDSNNDNRRARVAYHMIALGLLKDKSVVIKALNDWYNNPDIKYKAWAEKYPIVLTENVLTAATRQKAWQEKAEINVTPTILLNGYKLPAPYQLTDLKQLID